jgi:hypothetical protein
MMDFFFRNFSGPLNSYLIESLWIFGDYLYSKIDLTPVWSSVSQLDVWTIFWASFGLLINVDLVSNRFKNLVQNLIRKLLSQKNFNFLFFKSCSLICALLKNCCNIIMIFGEFIWFELQNLRKKCDNQLEKSSKIQKTKTIKKSSYLYSFLNTLAYS